MNLRAVEFDLQLRHRHGDGTWADMEAVPEHQHPAQHDPERDWSRWRLFRCRTCEETLSVRRSDIEQPGAETGG